VEYATAFQRVERVPLSAGDAQVFARNVLRVDDRFFDVFSFELLRGSTDRSLHEPGQVVLTASTARRLFGEDDPMGQAVTTGSGSTVRVAGIAADPPATSHFQFDALLSTSGAGLARRFQSTVQWQWFDYYLYVKTRDRAAPDALQAKLDALVTRSDLERTLVAQPLTRIHLHSAVGRRSALAPQSDVRYLYIFGAVGLLILGIACANYVNLSTARGLRRIREVGVRKTMGATRPQLVRQFLGESVLTAALAFPLAVGGVYLALPLVNQATGLALSVSLPQHGALLGAAALGTLALGVAAGGYPAFVLSAFAPTSVLGGQAPLTGQRSWLRNGLVAAQFAAAAGLLLGTMVVQSQLRFVQNQQLGTEDHIITFRGRDLGDQYRAFKRELQQQPHVANVAIGSPPGIGWGKRTMTLNDKAPPDERTRLFFTVGDADYLETVGLRLLAGRNFPPGVTTEGFSSKTGYLVNETFAQKYGVTPDDVGSRVDTGGPGFGGPDLLVRGIVADFHNASLREPIPPLLIEPPQGPAAQYARPFVVRLADGQRADGLKEVRAVWNAMGPGRPLNYQFLDDQIEAQYADAQQLMRVFGLLAGIALLVTGLGLLGLTAYMAERRTKEVGIRKAVGATAASIVWLFSKDVARLVLVGVAVGLPLAYLGAAQWLQRFAYQAAPGVSLLGVIAAVFVLGLAATSMQALRAARIDPAETLRRE
jgi:putative ABC transport system permease protein